MKVTISTVGLLFLNTFIETTTASCGHGTSLLRRKVNINKRQEKTVEVGKFGYIGTQGPTGWAGLAAENAACAVSKQQSPIDVTNTSTTVVAAGTLKLDFPTVAAAEFENLGTTIEVVMEGKNASTTVDGKTFALKQFHFHTPSEHTVDGEYFPLEMHMVHEAADGAIAVIATHFQLSSTETTSLLTSVTENIDKISTPGTITETGALDFAPFVAAINAQSLNTYSGSLTTPPCAEGLAFFVTSQQLPIDVATFNKVKAVVGFNARFAQNTAGQDNLLSLAAKQVAVAEGGVDRGNSSSPAAPAAPSTTTVTVPAVAAPSAAPVVEKPAAIATPAVPAAPVAPSAAPARNGNVQVISPGGGAAGITPETAKLIESLTGVKVPA